MQPLRLCLLLAFIAVLRAYELSQNLAEFYCVRNGNYSNREQMEKDGANRTLIDLRVQPVLAPALSPIPVVYMEQINDGVLARALILIVTEGDDGVIFVTPNNFSGNTGIKPGTFDANQIKSFTPEDLQGRQDCKTSYKRVQPFIFSGDWRDCTRAAVHGKRQSYGGTLACDVENWIIHDQADEQPTLVPYIMKSNGHKYPLENAPSNYVCECDTTAGDNTSDNSSG